MKKVSAVISTDWHLKQENIDVIKGLISQQINIAKENNTSALICLGDVFDSRVSQREDVLNAFNSILDEIGKNGLTLYCIPGNHDKTNYKSSSSFLTPFSNHPALTLMSEPCLLRVNGVVCFCVPFYDTDMWLEKYNEVFPTLEEKPTVLLSHMAVNGSVNNDGSKVESKLNSKFLMRYKYVYLGHYHNAQQVYINTFHLPSIRQNNFGEDDKKGFTLMFDDGSMEFVQSKFKKYCTLRYELGETDPAKIIRDIRDQELEDANVKVEVTGTESELKVLNEEIFVDRGIILKKKRKGVDDDIKHESRDIIINKNSITALFKDFCKEKKYDCKNGMKYLQKYVK